MDAHFVNPWILYLLWLMPAVGVWWYAAKRKNEVELNKFISNTMQKKLRPPSSFARFAWQAGLIITGLFLMMIAAARPQWGTKEETVYQRGRDLVIALDVSRSMLANDLHPNRLGRAKVDIMDLVKELRGDRAALLAFRHKSILLCPLTTDYAFFSQILNAVTTDSAPRGETDIGNAIIKSLEAFESGEGSHKAIILISDGEDLSGRALEFAKKAKARKIPIFTVGLGSRLGSKIPDESDMSRNVKYKGNDIVTRLDHDTLYAIAKTTGGAYIPVETASTANTTLGSLYRNHLRNIAAQDMEETLRKSYVERYQIFLFPAVLLIMAAAFLGRGRLARHISAQESTDDKLQQIRNINPPKPALKNLVILTAFILFSLTTAAQTNSSATSGSNAIHNVTNEHAPNSESGPDIPPGRQGARIAQKLYKTGKYEEAARTYMEAAKGSTSKSQRDFKYNAGVALFKAGKFKEASEIMRELVRSEPEDNVDTAIGLGCALYRSAEALDAADPEKVQERALTLRQAGEAFKDAARAEKDSKSARHNLSVVLNKLPEVDEQARIARLMAEYAQTPPFQIADKMLSEQKRLSAEIPAAFSNETPEKIMLLENLAEQQKKNADLWIPLKGKLLNAMSQTENKNQSAAIEQMIENTRENMVNGYEALRNLDTEGFRSSILSEDATYRLWKGNAPCPALLRENILRQTNAIFMSESEQNHDDNSRLKITADQMEALALTKIFSQRFASSPPEQKQEKSPEEEKQAAIDHEKILQLAEQTVTSQQKALDQLKTKNMAGSLEEQHKSHELLNEIKKLLPKNKNKDNKQDQQKDQQDQQKQEKKQDQQKNPKEQKQPNEPQPPEQEPSPTEQKEEEKKEEPPEDVQKLLEKALQRERDHEAEKRRRKRFIPLPPSDRDW